MKLSERVIKLRKIARWTQDELAERANVPVDLVCAIEADRLSDPKRLMRVAAAFDMSVHELIAGCNLPEPEPEPTRQPTNGKSPDLLYCSFCNHSQLEVRKLIAGPGPDGYGVFICDDCVMLCNEILMEHGTLRLVIDDRPPPEPEAPARKPRRGRRDSGGH